MKPQQLGLSVIGDAQARADELGGRLGGTFDVTFTRFEMLESIKPGPRTLFDVDLNDDSLVVRIKNWIKAKPRDARVVFLADTTSLLQHARAHALGATDVIARPVEAHDLAKVLGWHVPPPAIELASLATASTEIASGAAPGLEAAAGGLRSMFSSACSGTPISPEVVTAAGEAIIDDVAELGLAKWIDAVRTHHSQTYQHCLLVTGAAAGFGQHIGLSRADRKRLSLAGMLHDIGKARIPIAILEKPGPLTDDERTAMKAHPQLGADLLQANGSLAPEMLDMVLHHHELLDGSGYPHGLSGSEISDLVRIITISDIFGALMERRSYKPAMSGDAAYQIMLDMGVKLDRDLMRAFRPVALGVKQT
ncbi:MAG: HD domain-containing protein [Alphaproteobacteria bacterium]|nr:HD domain-containing protein [Alphaproteobacteria bacterium]